MKEGKALGRHLFFRERRTKARCSHADQQVSEVRKTGHPGMSSCMDMIRATQNMYAPLRGNTVVRSATLSTQEDSLYERWPW